MRDVFNQTSVLLQPHIISLQDRDRNSATAPSIAHSPLLQRHWTLDPHARPGSVHMASLRPSPSCERIHTSPSGAYMTMSAVKKMSKTPPPPLRMRKQATPPLPDPTMLRDSEPILSGAMKYELALDEFVGAVRSFSTLVTTATPASDVVGTPILRQATQPQAHGADRTAGSPLHYLQSQRSRMVTFDQGPSTVMNGLVNGLEQVSTKTPPVLAELTGCMNMAERPSTFWGTPLVTVRSGEGLTVGGSACTSSPISIYSANDRSSPSSSAPHKAMASPDKPLIASNPWHGHGASYADAKTVLHAGRQQLNAKQTRRQLPLNVRQPAADEMYARWLGARTASVLEDPRKDPRPSNGKLLPPWLPPELGITDEDEAEAVAQLDARGSRRVLAQTRPQSAPTHAPLLDAVSPATLHVRMPISNARWSQTLVFCTDGLRPP